MSNSEKLNKLIDDKLTLCFNQRYKYTHLSTNINQKEYLDTFDGLKEKLNDKENLSANLSQLITLLVFIKSDLLELERVNSKEFIVSMRVQPVIKTLDADLSAYKAVLHSIGIQMQTVKELILIKHPNERLNIQ